MARLSRKQTKKAPPGGEARKPQPSFVDFMASSPLRRCRLESPKRVEPLRATRVAPRSIVFALAFLLAPLALSSDDVDVRKNGTLWARIERGGAVRIGGTIAGEIEKDGSVRVGGSIAGSVEKDGTIRDDGTIRGRVERDGTLRLDGTIVGRIEDDGAIRRNGSIWGSAAPCCSSFDETRRIAALLYFFESGFFRR